MSKTDRAHDVVEQDIRSSPLRSGPRQESETRFQNPAEAGRLKYRIARLLSRKRRNKPERALERMHLYIGVIVMPNRGFPGGHESLGIDAVDDLGEGAQIAHDNRRLTCKCFNDDHPESLIGDRWHNTCQSMEIECSQFTLR